MLIGNSRRWLLAAAVFPLVLAGCAGQGAGTGTAGTPAGSGTAASGSHRGLSAVRHVWVIELENQGYQLPCEDLEGGAGFNGSLN